jgi:hypothetical protein
MKRNSIYVLAIMMFFVHALQGAVFQSASLTPHLASSAAATCSFATSQVGITELHCPPFALGREVECVLPSSGQKERCASIGAHIIRGVLFCISTAGNAAGEKTCFDQPLYCASPRPGSSEGHCFENKGLLTQHTIKKRIKERYDWDHLLSLYQRQLEYCSRKRGPVESTALIDARERICPKQDESLDAYVVRVFVNAEKMSVSMVDSLPAQDVLGERSLFWQLPWTVQRYLLAVLATLDGHVDLNAVLPVAGMTLLDYVVQHQDEELAFLLWDKGARELSDDRLSDFFATMLRTSDERSVQVLKDIVDEEIGFYPVYGHKFSHIMQGTWVTDLSAELVEQKMAVLWKTYYSCRWLPDVKDAFDDTPGTKAFKAWFRAKECRKKCEIL